MFGKIKVRVLDSTKYAKKLGEEDPRRIFHAVKVGIAITLMSMFYYFKPLYHSFEEAGMWAILTVVVVFEFTVGGTIAKGLNRGAATLVAAGLGVGAEYLGNASSVATFTRFVPRVKRRYDYGVTIFILTFTLVAVSGARASQIWKMAYERLTTILIGGATCMVISLCIYPVWAGQDLHNLIATNIGKLATFLEGFGGQFCNYSADGEDKSYLQSHKTVLNSKANEEILVLCEFQQKIQPSCVEMSIESSKALRELAEAIKETRFPSAAVEIHLQNSKAAAEDLKKIMENSSLPTIAGLQEIVPILVITSVLIDIIKFVEKISTSVEELSQKAGFKQRNKQAQVKPVHDHVVIDVIEIKTKYSPPQI
ncbi:hypothetical protein SASPL_108763 [Salvia splendens]|uniref:Aluminum-activated malate transporter n=1 Tax=Salvia splendens TaxID=180675 RepID=A0A8X9A7R7_SALSN|nr:hypothetical protein SASPL_108763 [Salvia splendens]